MNCFLNNIVKQTSIYFHSQKHYRKVFCNEHAAFDLLDYKFVSLFKIIKWSAKQWSQSLSIPSIVYIYTTLSFNHLLRAFTSNEKVLCSLLRFRVAVYIYIYILHGRFLSSHCNSERVDFDYISETERGLLRWGGDSSAVFRRGNFRIGGSVFIKSTIPWWREFPLSAPLGGEGGWGWATKRHLHLDDCRRIELQRKLIRRRVTEDVATSRPAVSRDFEVPDSARARELLFKLRIPGSWRGLSSLPGRNLTPRRYTFHERGGRRGHGASLSRVRGIPETGLASQLAINLATIISSGSRLLSRRAEEFGPNSCRFCCARDKIAEHDAF